MYPRDTIADAERAVLGGMLLSHKARAEAARRLTPQHFVGDLQHGQMFSALCRLLDEETPPDDLTIRWAWEGEARFRPELRLELIGCCPASYNITAYIDRIEQVYARRNATLELGDALVAGHEGRDDRLLEGVERAHGMLIEPLQHQRPVDASELAALPTDVEWVIRGLIARQETALFVAEPGSGKSTLLSQVAVCSASGIHPWTHTLMEPVRVLLLDFQDSQGTVGRRISALLRIAERRYKPGMLHVIVRPEGIDLTTGRGQAEMEGFVEQTRPALIVCGPLYNMVSGTTQRSKHSEETAELAGSFLGGLLARHQAALMLEAHAPHGEELRVRGSKYWEDWAAFGLALKDDRSVTDRRKFTVGRFRGDREEHRQWPKVLIEGPAGGWPWIVPSGMLPPDPTHQMDPLPQPTLDPEEPF